MIIGDRTRPAARPLDGVVTRQEITPSNEPGDSTLTLTGEDLSVLMDLVEMPFMRYPAMPEIAQLYAILAKYAVLRHRARRPAADHPGPAHATVEGYDTHTGTDLEYIRQHARALWLCVLRRARAGPAHEHRLLWAGRTVPSRSPLSA